MAAAVAAVAVVAFAPTLANGFVDTWDDDKNFLENSSFRGLGPAQVAWAWRTYLMGVYQPVGWMLLEAQYAAWGMAAWGYHLASVLMHAGVAVALYAVTVAVLARAMPERYREEPGLVRGMAGLAAALFAAHPLRTEAVAWVSSQTYLPCALFGLLAVRVYLHACQGGPERPPRPVELAVVFVLSAAALLCKAPAVSLPATLLILDVYPLRRLGPGHWLDRPARRAWLEKVPFVALSLLFVTIAIRGRQQFNALVTAEQDPIVDRLARIGHTLAFYPARTVWPADLSAMYPIPSPSDPVLPLAALLVAGVTGGLIALRRRYPGALAAWASYLVLLAPNVGLVRIGRVVAADRYSYIASMGGVVLLAAGLCRLGAAPRGRARRPAVVAVGVVLTLVLTLLSWRQSRTWRDSQALWAHALAHGGDRVADVHDNMGMALALAGRPREAAEHYAEALRLNPRLAQAHDHLGVVLIEQRRYEEAEGHIRESLRIQPEGAAHNNLGMALAGRGDDDGAIAQFTEAARLRPEIALIHENLGRVLVRRGRFAEAAAALAEALRRGPDSAVTRNNLGSALVELGKLDEAQAQFAQALRLRPDYAEPHHGLGTVLARQGRRAEAAAEFAEALRLNPRHPQARRDLDALRP